MCKEFDKYHLSTQNLYNKPLIFFFVLRVPTVFEIGMRCQVSPIILLHRYNKDCTKFEILKFLS